MFWCPFERHIDQLFEWHIDHKAKQNGARKNGVPYPYVHEVVGKNRLMESGHISSEEWLRRGMRIA
jgi:hypothetical protein